MAPSLLSRQPAPGRPEVHDIQGLVASGYPRMTCAAYLLLRVLDRRAAGRWLADLADRVTTSRGRAHGRCVNVAFTCAGLKELGMSDGSLATFSASFQEGMATPHRSRILGDSEPSAPGGWAWGGPDTPAVHVLLTVFGDDDTFAGAEAEERERLAADGALEVVHDCRAWPVPRRDEDKVRVEHFGFADGISQPVVRGVGRQAKPGEPAPIDTGEFVLGYPNGYGKLTPSPRIGSGPDAGLDFGRNGTYLVFRQLSQDVTGFWRFLDDATKDAAGTSNPARRSHLGARMVGRWESGAPLVKAPDKDNPGLASTNDFGYAEDAKGFRCPLGAHVRRTNPRDSLGADADEALKLANLHRLLRRGRSYGAPVEDRFGPDDGSERGIHFICLNANIERQFEFVQNMWANNTKFAGLYDERDPLLGEHPALGGGVMTVQRCPVRQRIPHIQRHVTVRGGAYFFLPGVAALRHLATGAG